MCSAPGLYTWCLHGSLYALPMSSLCSSQVTRYLEFKTVDGSYVVKGSKVNKVIYRDGEELWLGLAWFGLVRLGLDWIGLTDLGLD